MRIIVNSSHASYFTLSAYSDSGTLKYVFFTIVIVFYICVIFCNAFLIVVICMNRSLHEPLYLFLCNLFVNELYGSTALFPFLLVQILSDVHTVNASFCLLQVFCVYTYASVEFSTLAIMSYDRYLAVCRPLQYNTLMTSKKIAALIAQAWSFPFLVMAVLILLTVPLRRCGNIIDTPYCSGFSIVKLSCSDITVNNVYGLLVLFLTVCCPIGLIFYTYIRIIHVCFSGSKQTRQKAVSTCTPQLASLVNFFFGCCFEVIQSRFNMSHVSNKFRIFLALYFLVCQPLFNPLLYGLKMSKIHIRCKRLFSLRSSNRFLK